LTIFNRCLLFAVIVRVPEDIPFTKSMSDCKILRDSFEQSPTVFIDTETTVERCMETIQIQTAVETGEMGTVRKPPLCLSRLARGGKTTILRLLFQRLKAEGFDPVYINFNGNFRRFRGESESEAILRLISAQLIDDAHKVKRIKCNESALEDYIQRSIAQRGRPFLLLIDELNSLANPPDEEAASLLRRVFLDPMNRYLVFSTHLPVFVDTTVSTVLGQIGVRGSRRGLKFAQMPESWDATVLRAMSPSCAGITKTEITLYGGIPSLLFSVKTASDLSPKERFADFQARHLPLNTDNNVLFQMLDTILTGSRSCVLSMFEPFSTVSADGEIRFPLVYIACILKFLNKAHRFGSLDAIVELIEVDLVVHAGQSGSGKEWEVIVTIAILLQCAMCEIGGTVLRLFDKEIGPVSYVTRAMISADCTTVEQAHLEILETMSKVKPGSVVVFSVANLNFRDFDGFVVYKPLDGGNLGSQPFQLKRGRGYPRKVNVPTWAEHAYLIQGKAAKKTTEGEKWKRLDESGVIKLLGYSMLPLMTMEVDKHRTKSRTTDPRNGS
jgi:hypothetical protein